MIDLSIFLVSRPLAGDRRGLTSTSIDPTTPCVPVVVLLSRYPTVHLVPFKLCRESGPNQVQWAANHGRRRGCDCPGEKSS